MQPTIQNAYTSRYKCNANANMHKNESYTYATKELPQPIQEIKHTPSSPRKQVKVA
jgi:hypothetical protein